jgi:hypothetical protein
MIEVLTVMQMVAAANESVFVKQLDVSKFDWAGEQLLAGRLQMVPCAAGGNSWLKFEALVDSHCFAAESLKAEDSVPRREAHCSGFVTRRIVP